MFILYASSLLPYLFPFPLCGEETNGKCIHSTTLEYYSFLPQ